MGINNVTMNNIPSIRKRDIGYRTVTDSGEQNEYQSEVLADILDLFNKANKIEKALDETKNIVDTENKYLQLKISELETKLAKVTQNYKNLTAADPNASKIIQLYPNDAYVESESYGAYIDLQNMDITMRPTMSVSKVGIYDEYLDQMFLPASLKVEIGPEDLKVGTHILEINDNDLLNPFNGDPSTYWVRKVVTDNTINEITCEMIITLPEDIITTRDINTIVINPYPISAVDIMSVEYKSNGSWNTLSAFKDHANSVLEEYADVFGTTYARPIILDAPNLKFNFREISANQIKITFRQRHYLQENPSRRVFHLGAKNIQILQNKYSKDYNVFNMVVDFPEKDRNIMFEDAMIVLNNPDEVVSDLDLVQCEYFYIDSYDAPHKISETIPFMVTTKKMLIKFKLYQGLATPNIKSVKVKYKTL